VFFPPCSRWRFSPLQQPMTLLFAISPWDTFWCSLKPSEVGSKERDFRVAFLFGNHSITLSQYRVVFSSFSVEPLQNGE